LFAFFATLFQKSMEVTVAEFVLSALPNGKSKNQNHPSALHRDLLESTMGHSLASPAWEESSA
jgi:hypothetical protein